VDERAMTVDGGIAAYFSKLKLIADDFTVRAGRAITNDRAPTSTLASPAQGA